MSAKDPVSADVPGIPAQAPEIPGYRHVYFGKVRDLYEPLDGTHLLVVATDRISAYDHVLTPGITDKGAILTGLSRWWFDRLADVIPSHLINGADAPEQVRERAMVVKKLDMFPVECVVRGYLTGSGLADYRRTGSVCGVQLPPGLRDGDRLPEPIFTPAFKAEQGEHDENITFAQVEDLVGADNAAALRDASLRLFTRAESIARERGIILADTKFEFGTDPETGQLTLGDEVLTPDSSRFWDGDSWQPGGPQPSFDKQFVRDWLTSAESGWDKSGVDAPPPLPEGIVKKTRDRYAQAYARLTGKEF